MVTLRGFAFVHSAGNLWFGHCCAVGGNREAARLAGIRVDRVTIMTYSFMGNNALVIAGVDFFWQQVVIGFIVVIAVTINNIRESRIGWLSQLRARLRTREA